MAASSVKRREDPMFAGTGQFVDVEHPSNMAIVRSPRLQAWTNSIDLAAAHVSPRSQAVLVGNVLVSRSNPIPVAARLPETKFHRAQRASAAHR